jgi:hypothetical protein
MSNSQAHIHIARGKNPRHEIRRYEYEIATLVEMVLDIIPVMDSTVFL